MQLLNDVSNITGLRTVKLRKIRIEKRPPLAPILLFCFPDLDCYQQRDN